MITLPNLRNLMSLKNMDFLERKIAKLENQNSNLTKNLRLKIRQLENRQTKSYALQNYRGSDRNKRGHGNGCGRYRDQ